MLLLTCSSAQRSPFGELARDRPKRLTAARLSPGARRPYRKPAQTSVWPAYWLTQRDGFPWAKGEVADRVPCAVAAKPQRAVAVRPIAHDVLKQLCRKLAFSAQRLGARKAQGQVVHLFPLRPASDPAGHAVVAVRRVVIRPV